MAVFQVKMDVYSFFNFVRLEIENANTDCERAGGVDFFYY